MAALAVLLFAAPAHAATFNVNSTADEPDADTSAPACATAGGACTLRAAIDQANFDESDSIINLPAGTYTLTGPPADDDNETGDLDIDSRGFTVTIAGAGARTTIIDANATDRVIDVARSSKVVIRGVTITGGDTDVTEELRDPETDGDVFSDIFNDFTQNKLSDGGGIYVRGASDDPEQAPSELTVTDSAITGNRAGNELSFAELLPEGLAEPLYAALVDAGASEELATLLIFGRFTFGDGGGIHVGERTQASIAGSTLAANAALDDGGAIESDAASLSILNSTIHGNGATGGSDGDGDGGGIEHNEGQLEVAHATITNNTAANKGGGVNVEQEECAANFLLCFLFGQPIMADAERDEVSATQEEEPPPPGASFRSTILSGNQAPDEGPNCRTDELSTLTSAGTNLEGGVDCGFTTPGDLQSKDPLLGPLVNNGGQTDTRALTPLSPALHTATTAPCPTTDQRGTVRPQGPACDIGAYERVLLADLDVTITDDPDPVVAGRNVTYVIRARNAGPDPATEAKVTFTIPPGTELQASAIGGGGTCSGATLLTCELGNMAVGQVREIGVIVRTQADSAQSSSAGAARSAQAGASLEATAKVAAAQTDPDTSNNEARASTSVEAPDADADRAGDADEGDDGLGDGVAGTRAAGDGDLPFTGLPLAILVIGGAVTLAGGITLRLLARFLD